MKEIIKKVYAEYLGACNQHGTDKEEVMNYEEFESVAIEYTKNYPEEVAEDGAEKFLIDTMYEFVCYE